MHKRENFFSSLLKFAVGPLGGAVISFITVPVTTWLVDPEQFGLTTMFTLLQTLLTSFIYLGLDQAYVREYNSSKYSNSKLLLNSILLPLFISGIAMIGIFFLMEPVSIYLFSEVNYLLMNCLIVWLPFVVIERFLLLNIRMQEKGLQYSMYNILTKIFIMILTIGLLLGYERTYTSIVLGTILSQIISCIILIFLSRKQFSFKNNQIDFALIKQMLKFGLPILPSVIIVWVLNSSDRLVLNYYSTIDEIGIYFAAMKLVTALNMIQSIFASFWVPMAYRWHEEGVEKEQFEKVSYGLGVFMGVLFIGVLLFKKIMVMILSPEYSEAQYILPFLLFSPIMYTMSETTTLGIAFSRKTHFNIWVSLIAAIVNLVVNFTFVPLIGGVGAAMGTGIAYIAFFWVRTLISRRYWYKFDLKFYFMNTETTTLGIAFSRKTHFNIWVSLIAAIVNLVVNFTFVPLIGGVGAAMGTGIAYIAFFWVRTLISRRYWYKFDLKFYFMNTIILLFVALVNVVLRNQLVYILNIIFLLVFILFNLPFIKKIISVEEFKQMIRKR